jgi:hypothetical protein
MPVPETLKADAGSRPFAVDAPAMISVLAGFDYRPDDPDIKIAQIDSAFTGTGNPKVKFDGEAANTNKTYPYIGATPRAGDRVIMRKLGDGWIIVGVIGGGLRYPNVFTAGSIEITTPQTGNNFTLASIAIPDPGWPYRLGGMAQAYFEAENVGNTQFDLIVRVNTALGLGVSRQGLGRPQGGRQSVAGPGVGATIYTGTNNMYMTLTRTNASTTGKLMAVFGAGYSGMCCWQIPA